MLAREEALKRRADVERELYPKFDQSAQADIARAFIEDLTNMRKDYMAAFIRQAEIREAAGLDADAMFRLGRKHIMTNILLVDMGAAIQQRHSPFYIVVFNQSAQSGG